MELIAVTIDGVTIGIIYAFVALGLTLIFSVFDTINFAHGTLYMLGSYLTWYFCVQKGLNFFVSCIIAVLILAMIGVVMERFLFRPLPRGHLPGLMLSTGVALALPVIVLVVFGAKEKGIPSVFPGTVDMLGIRISLERLALVPVCLVLVFGLIAFLRYTGVGKTIRAVSQDSEAAELYGINIGYVSGVTFAIGTALAGLAGALVAPLFMLTAEMGGAVIIKCFIIIIVGGLGSMAGAITAGILIGIVENVCTVWMGSEIAQMALFGCLILILLVKPRGLFGDT